MKLGIIGAMDVEVAHLKKVMTIESTLKKCSMEFCEGKLEGLDVVVVRCGIGKINAALCTQILVDDFNVDAVLNTGIAGSLNNDIEVGDMVVSENVVHHDFDLAPFGYKRGQLPGFKGVGFKADKQLVDLVTEVINELDMCGLFTGTICSGDQFVDSIEKKTELAEQFNGLCCEMEGASIAQAATMNGIPFVIVRAISDKADGTADVVYTAFEKKAAEQSAKMVQEIVKKLAAQQD